MNNNKVRARERVPTGRRGRPSKSMIAAAMERPFCAYLHKICLNNRLEGHKYCIDHIMNDKTAPFRQCTYVHQITGRRCSRAAHKVDRRASPLCQYHRNIRLNANSLPTISAEDELPELKQLVEDLSRRGQSSNSFWLSKPGLPGQAMPSDKLSRTIAKYRVHQGEQCQEIELPTMEEIASRNNADSDTESVDNDVDFFRHAQVFTEEELTRTLRDKMIKLRRLYIEQFSHIQYTLKEKRLKFIQNQRLESELQSYRNYKYSPDYPKLRAMLNYHKTFGQESLLQEEAKRKKISRPQAAGPHQMAHASSVATAATDTQIATICIFAKTPQGCDKPCIPLSPYCQKHILYDPKQVLFRPCAGGMPPCLAPVISYARKNRCWLHLGAGELQQPPAVEPKSKPLANASAT